MGVELAGASVAVGGISSSTTQQRKKQSRNHGSNNSSTLSDNDYDENDNEDVALLSSSKSNHNLSHMTTAATTATSVNNANTIITKTGLSVLLLLAVQNCCKNLVVRAVMKGQPQFLTSAAVLLSEVMKCTLSTSYILFYEQKSFQSIVQYITQVDRRNTILLIVPATAYNIQMSCEY